MFSMRTTSADVNGKGHQPRRLHRDLNLLLVHITARPPAKARALLAEVIRAGRELVAEANRAEGTAR